jgi:hypothetical protein
MRTWRSLGTTISNTPLFFVLLPDLPTAAELHAEVLDRGALQRFQRDHDQLVGGLGFEISEFFGEGRARRRIEDVGFIDDAAAERGEVKRERSRDEKEEGSDGKACASKAVAALSPPLPRKRGRERGRRGERRCAPHHSRPALPSDQNFTVGGRFTSSATVKVSIGLLPL